MKKQTPHCAKCNVLRCVAQKKNGGMPSSCPTARYADLINDTKEKYHLPENQAVIQ